MFKHIFAFLRHYKTLNPIYRIIIRNFINTGEINQIRRNVPIIVSLTSQEESFDNLEMTLYSIFNQTVAPDEVVLWLSNYYELSELPYSITKFVKNGLSIRFVDYKNSYTNILYTLKDYNDCIIVTADDNIYYPKNWLSSLYHSYISNSEDIQVHQAHKVILSENKIASCKEWKKFIDEENASFEYFPVSSGGILYPPGCFTGEVFREDIYKNKVNTSWQLWSWVMALVSGRKIRIVKNHIKRFSAVNLLKSVKDYYKNTKLSEKTDRELLQLMEYYRSNVYPKLT